MDVMDAARRLVALAPSAETFYREVFGEQGLLTRAFPGRAERLAFESTESYRQLVRCYQDLAGIGSRQERTVPITVDVPEGLRGRLIGQALVRGLTPEEFICTLLDDKLRVPRCDECDGCGGPLEGYSCEGLCAFCIEPLSGEV